MLGIWAAFSKPPSNDRADREYYIERSSRSGDERGMLYFKPPRAAGSAAVASTVSAGTGTAVGVAVGAIEGD